MLGMGDRKDASPCSPPLSPAPDDRVFMLSQAVLYPNQSHLYRISPLTSSLMLTLPNNLPRELPEWRVWTFSCFICFMVVLWVTWPQELLVVSQPQDFLKAHFREVSAPQEGNQKMSELWEGSCNHFETYVPVIQLCHLSAIHPAPVAAGPQHLPDRSVHFHHKPQCRQGTKVLVNNAWWRRKICRAKPCPALPSAKSVTICLCLFKALPQSAGHSSCSAFMNMRWLTPSLAQGSLFQTPGSPVF